MSCYLFVGTDALGCAICGAIAPAACNVLQSRACILYFGDLHLFVPVMCMLHKKPQGLHVFMQVRHLVGCAIDA